MFQEIHDFIVLILTRNQISSLRLDSTNDTGAIGSTLLSLLLISLVLAGILEFCFLFHLFKKSTFGIK